MDTFTTVLSVFSTVCAIVFGYIAFVRKTNTEFVTRLTDVEASAKQAHKRLDHIEKRMDQAE